MPDKRLVLDIALLLFGALFGVPQLTMAVWAKRPRNLRTLELLLGFFALFAAAAGGVHLSGGSAGIRASLLGISACFGIAWALCLLSLARHNTTM